MYKLLITGGEGDLSQAICKSLDLDVYDIYTPNRSELDVSDAVSVENYLSRHNFDIVINNAGTLYSSTIKDSDVNLWIRDINVNLIGTYLVSRSAILHNQDPLIINVASTAAFNSYNDWSSYCASKAGVIKISKALSIDGYNVYCLCPGAIDTKLRDNLNINNPNVMCLDEAIKPFIDVLNGKYSRGDLIFYRKGSLILNPCETVN